MLFFTGKLTFPHKSSLCFQNASFTISILVLISNSHCPSSVTQNPRYI